MPGLHGIRQGSQLLRKDLGHIQLSLLKGCIQLVVDAVAHFPCVVKVIESFLGHIVGDGRLVATVAPIGGGQSAGVLLSPPEVASLVLAIPAAVCTG